jgi:hypothetical protein
MPNQPVDPRDLGTKAEAAVVVTHPGDRAASVLHTGGLEAVNARETRARLLARGWEIRPLPSDPAELDVLLGGQHLVVQAAARRILAAGQPVKP